MAIYSGSTAGDTPSQKAAMAHHTRCKGDDDVMSCLSASSSSCVGPEQSVDWYLKRQEAPGPRARQLRRRDVPAIVKQRDAYRVCEKSDGVRLVIVSRALIRCSDRLCRLSVVAC